MASPQPLAQSPKHQALHKTCFSPDLHSVVVNLGRRRGVGVPGTGRFASECRTHPWYPICPPTRTHSTTLGEEECLRRATPCRPGTSMQSRPPHPTPIPPFSSIGFLSVNPFAQKEHLSVCTLPVPVPVPLPLSPFPLARPLQLLYLPQPAPRALIYLSAFPCRFLALLLTPHRHVKAVDHKDIVHFAAVEAATCSRHASRISLFAWKNREANQEQSLLLRWFATRCCCFAIIHLTPLRRPLTHVISHRNNP